MLYIVRINTDQGNTASPATATVGPRDDLIDEVSSLNTDFTKISHGDAAEEEFTFLTAPGTPRETFVMPAATPDPSEDDSWEHASMYSAASWGTGEVIEFDERDSGHFGTASSARHGASRAASPETLGESAIARSTPPPAPTPPPTPVPADPPLSWEQRCAVFGRLQQQRRRNNTASNHLAWSRWTEQRWKDLDEAVGQMKVSSEGICQFLHPVEASLGRLVTFPLQIVGQVAMGAFLTLRIAGKAYFGIARIWMGCLVRRVEVDWAGVMFWASDGEDMGSVP